MTAHKSVSSSGSGETTQEMRLRQASCAHHWILGSTKYPVIEPLVGQVNLGRTRGYCKKCGKTRRWESPAPDSVYGAESVIAYNVRKESDALPDGFRLEIEDYSA